ncbi:MAG: hypothetical protein ACRD3I_14870, partial [Terriglobales bacterium]
TIAERIRLLLKSVKPEKLSLVPDCGFSQTPRFLAFPKLRNLVQAAEMVRAELAGAGFPPFDFAQGREPVERLARE